MTNTEFKSLADFRDLESINAYYQLVDEEHLVDGATMMDYLRFHSRDNARTPMQWDASANAGFTTGTPWITANPNYPEINVEAALADPDSVFYHYQKLIQLRHDLPVLTEGNFQLLDGNADDEQVFAYQRRTATQTLTVIANFTDLDLTRDYPQAAGSKLLLSNYADDQGDFLRPYEAKVYLAEKG